MSLIPADALTRGSMGHIVQAHQHAIWGARTPSGVWVDETWYDDPTVFLDPEEAVQMWCDTNGGHEHLDRMIETFHRYMESYPECPGDVIAVEYPITAVLGTKDNEWGLWVVHPEDQHFNRRAASVKAFDGGKIIPSPLNCPGHPDCGSAVVLTRRLDLVIRDHAGRIFIWDHKHRTATHTLLRCCGVLSTALLDWTRSYPSTGTGPRCSMRLRVLADTVNAPQSRCVFTAKQPQFDRLGFESIDNT